MGIVTQTHIGSHLYAALAGLQLAYEYACQSGLTLAIAAHEGYAVALLDGEVGTRKDALGVELLAHLLNLGHNLTTAWCRGELQVQCAQVLLVNLYAVEPFELLDAALHLVALGGFVAEFLDKLFGLFDHSLLVVVGGHLSLSTLLAQLHILAVRHLVVVDLAQQ